MTPRAGIMKFRKHPILGGNFCDDRASFSDDVWSQIARLAARDPGVRSGPVPSDPNCRASTPIEQRAFEVGLEAFGKWHLSAV